MKPLTGSINSYGYRRFGRAALLEHVLVAERALGHPLPSGAIVHHINGVRDDNRPENLVVCPDAGYHNLIHARQRALDACGHAGWRLCFICKQWSPSEALYVPPKTGQPYHRECKAEQKRLTARARLQLPPSASRSELRVAHLDRKSSTRTRQ